MCKKSLVLYLIYMRWVKDALHFLSAQIDALNTGKSVVARILYDAIISSTLEESTAPVSFARVNHAQC